VFAVRQPDKAGKLFVVSAWTDEYCAKYEAARWTQDLKEDWDYVPAVLVVEENDDAPTTE
jgi:hypothetical protein